MGSDEVRGAWPLYIVCSAFRRDRPPLQSIVIPVTIVLASAISRVLAPVRLPLLASRKNSFIQGISIPPRCSSWQSLRLIAICGWEPRLLPASILPPFSHPATPPLALLPTTPQSQAPSLTSVVLDCGLCGASVGLWSFSAVERPQTGPVFSPGPAVAEIDEEGLALQIEEQPTRSTAHRYSFLCQTRRWNSVPDLEPFNNRRWKALTAEDCGLRAESSETGWRVQ